METQTYRGSAILEDINPCVQLRGNGRSVYLECAYCNWYELAIYVDVAKPDCTVLTRSGRMYVTLRKIVSIARGVFRLDKA